MAHGGARVGAGRKAGSHSKSKGKLVVMPSVVELPPEQAAQLARPPMDLAAAAAEIWARLAPLAIDQGTLIPATAIGFQELCDQMAVKQDLLGRLTDGLLPRYEKAVQRVDSSLARFRLTAFGKPLEPTKKARASAPNPWARIVSRG